MLGFAAGLSRRSWSIGSARFMRDVFASVLAAGIAAVAFSHLSHEPAPPAHVAERGKNFDRLSWEMEEVPSRATRTYDSLAMFALPRVEPITWSEAPVRTAEAVAPVHAERSERAPPVRVAALPPSRPVDVVPTTVVTQQPVTLAMARIAEPEAKRGGLEVFGWQVPGSDLIPAALPDGRAALKTVVALGQKVGEAPGALADTIGLR